MTSCDHIQNTVEPLRKFHSRIFTIIPIHGKLVIFLYRDKQDEEFVIYPDKFETVDTVFSYTNGSSYHGIFRVMLEDIIKVGVKEGVFDKCGDADAIYVTSYPCDQEENPDNTVACYDDDKRMHMVGTVFKIKKPVANDSARGKASANDSVINDTTLQKRKRVAN